MFCILKVSICVICLFFIGISCSKQPLAPKNLNNIPESSFAKAVTENFIVTLQTAETIKPGESTITKGGVMHSRGQVLEAHIDGDFEATAIITVHYDRVLDKGKGVGRGSFIMEVNQLFGNNISGTWEIQFQGETEGPVGNEIFSGYLNGKGTSGDLLETKILGTFTNKDDPSLSLFTLTGRILFPHGE